MEIFSKNPLYVGVKLPGPGTYPGKQTTEPLERRFASMEKSQLSILKVHHIGDVGLLDSVINTHLVQKCLRYEPDERLTATKLLQHPYFSGFAEWYQHDLKSAVQADKEDFEAHHAKLLPRAPGGPLKDAGAATGGGLAPLGPLTPRDEDDGPATGDRHRLKKDGSTISVISTSIEKKHSDDGKLPPAAGASGVAAAPIPEKSESKGIKVDKEDEFDEEDEAELSAVLDEEDEDKAPSSVRRSVGDLSSSHMERSSSTKDFSPGTTTSSLPPATSLANSSSSSSNTTALPATAIAAATAGGNLKSPITSPRTLPPAIPLPASSFGLSNLPSPVPLASSSSLPATIMGSTPRLEHKRASNASTITDSDVSIHSREPSRADILPNASDRDDVPSRHGSPRSRAQSRVEEAKAKPKKPVSIFPTFIMRCSNDQRIVGVFFRLRTVVTLNVRATRKVVAQVEPNERMRLVHSLRFAP